MFSRDIPHEVVNYRLDLGAVSFIPRDAQLQATEILKDELTLVVPPKHALAKRKEVDVEELERRSVHRRILWNPPFRRKVIELFARHRTALDSAHGYAKRVKASSVSCRWEWAWRVCR